MRTPALLPHSGLLGLLAGHGACAAPQLGSCTASGDPAELQHGPSLADFAEGDRTAVAAMLREVPSKFRQPSNVLPGARGVTILVTCLVEPISSGVVDVRCPSAAPRLDLAVDERNAFHLAVVWAQREFGVAAATRRAGCKSSI